LATAKVAAGTPVEVRRRPRFLVTILRMAEYGSDCCTGFVGAELTL
jgi:hypothetical protein